MGLSFQGPANAVDAIVPPFTLFVILALKYSINVRRSTNVRSNTILDYACVIAKHCVDITYEVTEHMYNKTMVYFKGKMTGDRLLDAVYDCVYTKEINSVIYKYSVYILLDTYILKLAHKRYEEKSPLSMKLLYALHSLTLYIVIGTVISITCLPNVCGPMRMYRVISVYALISLIEFRTMHLHNLTFLSLLYFIYHDTRHGGVLLDYLCQPRVQHSHISIIHRSRLYLHSERNDPTTNHKDNAPQSTRRRISRPNAIAVIAIPNYVCKVDISRVRPEAHITTACLPRNFSVYEEKASIKSHKSKTHWCILLPTGPYVWYVYLLCYCVYELLEYLYIYNTWKETT